MSMLGVEIERIWMSSSVHRSVRRLALMCGLVLVIYVAVLGQCLFIYLFIIHTAYNPQVMAN